MGYKKSVWIEKNILNLHKKSLPVPITDSTVMKRLESSLMSKFKELHEAAQGISAIQIGEPYRAALIRYKKGRKPFIMFNPTVLYTVGEHDSNEGCLSELDKRYYVKRPLVMRVKYYSNGKWKTKTLFYKKARIVAHEIDHMDGILLRDREKAHGNNIS